MNTIDCINIVSCPHCMEYIEILELNCKIFRHGVFKNNGKQINPHASLNECMLLIKKELIYGCGKPFQINIIDGKMIVNKCEYI